MVWRKWFVRGLVFGIVGLIACAAYLYQYWTNPQAVRRKVIDKIQTMLPKANVKLQTARLRVFGGIALHELRLARWDQTEQSDLLYVPRGVLYHDKEKLLEGSLSLRKIELTRPRLHFIRQKDGKWNLQGLFQPKKAVKALPTIVISQGVLVIEDRTHSPHAVVELKNVDVTLINDPLTTVMIRGSGHSDILGKIELHGIWNRDTQDIAVTIHARDMKLDQSLIQRCAAVHPHRLWSGLKLRGIADVKANIRVTGDRSSPVSYKAHCKLRETEIDHPQLPAPLKNLTAEIIAANDQLRVVDFRATAKGAALRGTGVAWFPSPEQNFETELQIDHITLNADLYARLPEYLQKSERAFTPRGPVSVDVHCAKRNGAWVTTRDGRPSEVSLCPEGISVSCRYFPYPLDRLTGNVDMNLATQHTKVSVVGYTGEQPVHVKGDWIGHGIDADARFEIQANDIPLDEKLISALPEKFQKVARTFHATGKCNLKSHVRHIPGRERYFNTYHAYFHDTKVKWDKFPYPLKDVSGYLDIYPSHFEFRDFRARNGDSIVLMRGASVPKSEPDAGNLIVHIQANNIAFDDDLQSAVSSMRGLEKTWETFRPSGRGNCTIRFEHSTAPEDRIPPADPIAVVFTMDGGVIEPAFFPYTLHHVKCDASYDDYRIEIKKFVAWHNGAKVSLGKGIVDLDPGGGYYAQLFNLKGEELRCTEDFSRALPEGLKEGCASLKLHDPVHVVVRKIIIAQNSEPGSRPDLYWDGKIVLPKARFHTGLDWSNVTGEIACVGRHDGRRLLGLTGNALFNEATLLKQPFRNVHARFQMNKNAPEVLNLDLRAPLFDGDVAGQVRVEFHSTLRYEMNLTASQINLVKFGEHNLGADANLKGYALARLHLSGKGDNVESMEGNGSIDVPRGRLHNLPLMLELLKTSGFRGVDRTMFEEAHAEFGIHGSRLEIRKLQMMGNIVSLTGKGSLNLDGTDVHLDFYPSWARVEQLLPPTLRPLPTGFTKNFLKIEMRGQISSNRDELKFLKKPVPILLDPLWNMRNRVMEVRANP